MNLIFKLLLIFGLSFGANYFQPNLQPNSSGGLNIPDTLRLVGIMAQFQLENPDNSKTSGNGQFLFGDVTEYINFFESEIPRCEGFLVDRPPHDSLYFQKQLEAVGNYYTNVSDSNLFYTAKIIENPDSTYGYYTVSYDMEYYAQADTSLADFFTEALKLAADDIEDYFDFENLGLTPDELVFVVFHAGLGQDFSYPSLDPTIYDLKSAYIDKEMMQGVTPTVIFNDSIYTGILLPETQNIIYYDVVEDIYGNPDYGIDDLCYYQYGLTGIFAFWLGYELGFPPMFDTESGDPGVGIFGLMDYGFNNGRGVIPAPPTPWTRIKAGWLDPIVIDPYDGLDININIPPLNISNQVYQIKIAEDEYFLIENRNNHIISNYDIKFLQYLLWDDYLCEKCSINCSGLDIDEIENRNDAIEKCIKDNPFSINKFHYFDMLDSLISYDPSLIIEDELENNIFTNFINFDFGLPGSGILIWHINEPDQADINIGVNSDLNNRHIQIEEADGAQDIGTRSYAFFASDDPTTGTRWDFWFLGNVDYEYANPGMDDRVIFDNESSPNTRTTEGAESFISIEILSEISDTMIIRVIFNEDLEIVNLSDEPVQYLGNAVENNIGFVYYAKGDSIYCHSHVGGKDADKIFNSSLDKFVFTYEDSVYITDNQYFWFDTIGTGHSEYKTPLGYILDYNSPDTASISLISSDSYLAFGDIDQDGLDEIITIEDGNIIARNSNGTLVNGFPTSGDFSGVPLISNILPPQYGSDIGKPEIICREGDDIVILSNRGERLRQLSSYDIDQPLAMVPFWRGDTTIALIDGSRLFLFDLDMDHSYWLNPKSRPSGFPLSTGKHDPENRELMRRKAYNYPNPITDGSTIFRFYVGSSKTTEVQIKIYNAAGYLVVDNLVNSKLASNEFNEIQWNASQVDAGLYFAEIKPDVGSSELVRLVVIK